MIVFIDYNLSYDVMYMYANVVNPDNLHICHHHKKVSEFFAFYSMLRWTCI
jgi:hypothetical protein